MERETPGQRPRTNYGHPQVAGTCQRAVEGDPNLQMLARTLAALRPPALTGALTHTARPWANEITLF